MENKVQVKSIVPESKSAILFNYVFLDQPKLLSQFCVDGRKGDVRSLYTQSLGGSYHMVTVNWLLRGGHIADYESIRQQTFTGLKDHGYQLSVHTGHHSGESKSDCGFADNNGKIIKTLSNRQQEIWDLLTTVNPDLVQDQSTWQEIMKLVNQAEVNLLPTGDQLIKKAQDEGAVLQTLDGDHQEIAAVVNLKDNTTLNVDNNQQTQAFNLDLWFVLQQATDLNIDQKKTLLLSLGLYVATEMVLVEMNPKKGYRLPIIINQ